MHHSPFTLVNQVLNLYAANAAVSSLADSVEEVEARLLKIFDAHKMTPTDIFVLLSMLHAQHELPSLKLNDLEIIDNIRIH